MWSDGSLHRDPESGVCAARTATFASVAGEAFKQCAWGHVDKLDDFPIPVRIIPRWCFLLLGARLRSVMLANYHRWLTILVSFRWLLVWFREPRVLAHWMGFPSSVRVVKVTGHTVLQTKFGLVCGSEGGSCTTRLVPSCPQYKGL